MLFFRVLLEHVHVTKVYFERTVPLRGAEMDPSLVITSRSGLMLSAL